MSETNKAALYLLNLQARIDGKACALCGGPTLMRGIHGHAASCPDLGTEEAARDLQGMNEARFIGAAPPALAVRAR